MRATRFGLLWSQSTVLLQRTADLPRGRSGLASTWPVGVLVWPGDTYEGDGAGRVAQRGAAGGSEFAADRAVPRPDSENEEAGGLRGLEQGMVRGAIDDLSVHDDVAFKGCLGRDCRAEESVGCR